MGNRILATPATATGIIPAGMNPKVPATNAIIKKATAQLFDMIVPPVRRLNRQSVVNHERHHTSRELLLSGFLLAELHCVRDSCVNA
jgi:hypothetical protein